MQLDLRPAALGDVGQHRERPGVVAVGVVDRCGAEDGPDRRAVGSSEPEVEAIRFSFAQTGEVLGGDGAALVIEGLDGGSADQLLQRAAQHDRQLLVGKVVMPSASTTQMASRAVSTIIL